jgi:anti-sigma regulatory factor (Ser/Thr protein kinase)
MARLLLRHSRPEMARLSRWLDNQEHILAIPVGMAHAVRMCLEEAVVNLLDHSPPTTDGPEITVTLAWHGDVMVAVIEDRGSPFDPRTISLPRRPESLDDAIPGGLGILLIRSYASDIEYDTLLGRNRLTLRFVQSVGDAYHGKGA